MRLRRSLSVYELAKFSWCGFLPQRTQLDIARELPEKQGDTGPPMLARPHRSLDWTGVLRL